MTQRTLIGSLSLAALLLTSSAGPVLAECSPHHEQFPPRYAFTATVEDFAYRGQRETPEYAWHLTLQVGRIYRGRLPGVLKATGNEAGCGFNGIEVRTGERLFIAAEDVDTSDPSLIRGESLIWREVAAGRWEFYADALQDGALGYPATVVRADTIEEILGVVGVLRTPETATAPVPAVTARTPTLPILAAVFALSLLVGLRGVGTDRTRWSGSRLGTLPQ